MAGAMGMTWFEDLTGFREQSPSQVRENIVVDDRTMTSRVNGTGGLAPEPSLLDQVRGNDAVDDAQHLAPDRRTAREQETQRIRKAQYPLAHRLFGKDLVHQQRGAFCNCSCIALPRASLHSSAMRRAPQLGQKPLTSTEGHEMFRMTAITAHPQETVLKPPALEVVLKPLLDIPGQFAALLCQMGLERGVVFLDKLVKKGPFRPAGAYRAAPLPGLASLPPAPGTTRRMVQKQNPFLQAAAR